MQHHFLDPVHSLPRLYVVGDFVLNQTFLLSDAHAHYLRHVLRRGDASMLRVFNPEQGEFLTRLKHVGKKEVGVTVLEMLRPAAAHLRHIHLFFAPLKKDKMDFLIEKAVELGVTDLHPVLFQRGIVREVKVERINAQIIEAAEQCERMDIPVLHPLLPLLKVAQHWDASLPLLAALERGDYPCMSEVVVGCESDIGYLVGPEGGITPEEVLQLLNIKSIHLVSLGARILRAETAALYGLSLLDAARAA